MTLYPFLKPNLDALEKENPFVHGWLHEQLSCLGPSDKLVQNSRGFLDWRLPTGKSLFGQLLPWLVYKNWRIPEAAESGASIVIGSNLGYGLNYFLPKVPSGHQVLVLEPRPDLLLACLGHTDYRPFVVTRKLHFLAPDLDRVRDTLSSLIRPCLLGKIFLKADLPSLQLGPEYPFWIERCKEALRDLKSDLHTIRPNHDETPSFPNRQWID